MAEGDIVCVECGVVRNTGLVLTKTPFPHLCPTVDTDDNTDPPYSAEDDDPPTDCEDLCMEQCIGACGVFDPPASAEPGGSDG